MNTRGHEWKTGRREDGKTRKSAFPFSRLLVVPSSAVALLTFFTATAATHEVGPNKTFYSLNQVPWESLHPGDEVLIHARTDPYKEKFVLAVSGTKEKPIIIRGVPGLSGELPVIDGDAATTRAQLDYWGDVRSVVKIGGAKVPESLGAQWIVLENLDIRGGRPPATFKAADGKKKPYAKNAAALWVEKAQHLVVRHCTLRDSGNGLFISSNDRSASEDIVVEKCYIYNNGNPGSGYEHNVYSEAIDLTFQFNHLGHTLPASRGNNLKDRSAGLVVRYNWIEGGDKVLDLVEGEDSALVRNHPNYKQTFVYGNVIIKPDGVIHPPVVHFGGDGANKRNYRHGTLFFYNNTVISYRKSATALFWPGDENETIDCRNNIVYLAAAPGKSLSLLQGSANLRISQNWFKTGMSGAGGTSLFGDKPGFVNEAARDFHLTDGSPCRGAGGALAAEVPQTHWPIMEYASPQNGAPRKNRNDLGAFVVAK
jgi:hypothetical protein